MAEQEQVRLIDVLDKNTHDLIFHVKQKLHGIRAEINAKLESAAYDPSMYHPELINKFRTLQQETETGLTTIDAVISMEIGEDIDIELYRQQNEKQIAEFAAQLETFVTQASGILSKI